MSGFADRADTACPAIGFTTTLPSASGRVPMPAVLNGFSRGRVASSLRAGRGVELEDIDLEDIDTE
ncbi:hypothetical protein ABIC03_005605 [Bradyrhizobium sp. RT6a]